MSGLNFPGLISSGGGSTEVSDTTYSGLATKCAALADGTLVYLRNSTGGQYAQFVVSSGVPYLNGPLDLTKYDGVDAPCTLTVVVNTNSHGTASWVSGQGPRISIANAATAHKCGVRLGIPIYKRTTNSRLVNFSAVHTYEENPLHGGGGVANGIGVCSATPTTTNSVFLALYLIAATQAATRYIGWGDTTTITLAAGQADINPAPITSTSMLAMGSVYWGRVDANQTQQIGGVLPYNTAPAVTAGSMSNSTSNIFQILGLQHYPLMWAWAQSGVGANSACVLTLNRFEAVHL